MKISVLSRNEKPSLKSLEIEGDAITMRISDEGYYQDYFIFKKGKLKKIRNKKTRGIIGILIKSFE